MLVMLSMWRGCSRDHGRLTPPEPPAGCRAPTLGPETLLTAAGEPVDEPSPRLLLVGPDAALLVYEQVDPELADSGTYDTPTCYAVVLEPDGAARTSPAEVGCAVIGWALNDGFFLLDGVTAWRVASDGTLV